MTLSRGNRVNMIRELAQVLNHLPSWAEIDLVLSEFGFNVNDVRGYDDSYVLRILRTGTDGDLLELHQHLLPSTEPPEPEPDAPNVVWQPGQLRLFISHITADKLVVSALKQHLAHWYIDGFVAHEDIEPSSEWLGEIDSALRTCHAMLAYLTPDFHKSQYTDHEVGYCLYRRVPIVLVKCGVDPYGFVARFQALQGVGISTDDLAGQVASVLAARPETASLMSEPLVSALESSGSFASTRSIMSVIDRATGWTPEQLARMERAVEDNRQVREAVMPLSGPRRHISVPERIGQIISQHQR